MSDPLRVTLSTQALLALIGDDPELEVTLKSIAREQVAQAFKRRVVPTQIAQEVDNALREAISNRPRDGSNRLVQAVQIEIVKLAGEIIERTVAQQGAALIQGIVNEAAKNIEERVLEALTTRLQPRIDKLILSRIQAVFERAPTVEPT